MKKELKKIQIEIDSLKEYLFDSNGMAKYVYDGDDWEQLTINQKFKHFSEKEDLPIGIAYDMGTIRGLEMARACIIE